MIQMDVLIYSLNYVAYYLSVIDLRQALSMRKMFSYCGAVLLSVHSEF